MQDTRVARERSGAAASTGAAEKSQKAPPITLQSKMSLPEAAKVTLQACQSHWERNLPAAIAGKNPEGVHQVRVGLRRFRIALGVFEDVVPALHLVWLNDESRALAKALGPVRDLDVFLGDVFDGAVPAKLKRSADAEELLKCARNAQRNAQLKVASLLQSARYERFITRVNGLYSKMSEKSTQGRRKAPATPLKKYARDVLKVRIKKVRKYVRALHHASPDELHKLRLKIKKARYTLEFFTAVLPKKRSMQLRSQLATLQVSLGRFSDVKTAHHIASSLSESATSDRSRKILKHGSKRVSKYVGALADKCRPKTIALVKRLRSISAS